MAWSMASFGNTGRIPGQRLLLDARSPRELATCVRRCPLRPLRISKVVRLRFWPLYNCQMRKQTPDSQDRYHLVGVRKDGSRAIVLGGMTLNTANRALAAVNDARTFTSVQFEIDAPGQNDRQAADAGPWLGSEALLFASGPSGRHRRDEDRQTMR
jgi:hypothetical protein